MTKTPLDAKLRKFYFRVDLVIPEFKKCKEMRNPLK